MKDTPLSASLEDYLETVYVLIKERGKARSNDIAERMGVHKSTVTAALHALSHRGLVNYTPYKPVSLTGDGRRRAQELLRRHDALRRFLENVLRIDWKAADETACKMEHIIAPAIMQRFTDFAAYMAQCPRAGAVWRKGLGYSCASENLDTECSRCMARARASQRAGGERHAAAGDGSAAP